jgi:hypothetical protein
MEQEITDYILQAQKHGLSDFEIKQNLLNAGWEAPAVEESFTFAKATESRPPQNYRTEAPSALSPLQGAKPAGNEAPVQPAQPTIAISEQHFAQTNSASGSRKKVLAVISILLVLGLAGGAYAYYVKVYNTADRVWSKALSAPKEAVFKSSYSLNYDFKPQGASSSTPVGFGVSGTGYFDLQNPKDPKLSANVSITAKADPISFNFNLGYLVLNKILYLDVSKIPELKGFLGREDLAWIKFDLAEIQKSAGQSTSTAVYQNPFNPSAALSAETLAKWAKVVKPGKFLAKEELDGVKVYHLKNEFDMQAFIPLFIESINESLAKSTPPQKEITAEQKAAITVFFNKVQFKEFDTWIGQEDYRIYKTHIVINAPSPDDLESSAGFSIAPTSINRDAKRLEDVRRLAAAFELYYNDNGKYPDAQEGQALEVYPKYTNGWPTAPVPADGTCTDYYNTYWYETEKNGQDYKLTFCLGAETAGYAAGIGSYSLKGIEANIACPSAKVENCAVPLREPEPVSWAYEIAKWKFGATIKFDFSYSDFGKTESLPTPVNPVDFLELVKAAFSPVFQKLQQ